jgi:hypothetical protein
MVGQTNPRVRNWSEPKGGKGRGAVMGQSPFAKRPAKDPTLGRRRSSRLDFVTPVILTGRDATGQPFHEETETYTVNLHGAKIKTRHSVLVGMQVGLECPRSGMSGKAVCVRIIPSESGEPVNEMAVQLIVPANLWGIENPPEDWIFEGAAGAGRSEATGRSSGIFFAGTHAGGLVEEPPARSPTSHDVSATAALDGFEKRVAAILEKALAGFETRLKTLEAESQARLTQHGEQALEQLEAFAEHCEQRLNDVVQAQREELPAATEETIRAKVSEVFAALLKPPESAPSAVPSTGPSAGAEKKKMK